MPTVNFNSTTASKVHIRIVEPDLYTCESLCLLFRFEGFYTSFTIDWDRPFSSEAKIDALLINVELPNRSGIGLLRQAKAELPGVPVIMISNSSDIDAAVSAMKFGAADVVKTPINNEKLVNIVRDALRRDLQFGAFTHGSRAIEIRGFRSLSDREREVLRLVVDGATSREVGEKLGISYRTADQHRANAMEKLNAKNTADLVRIVLTS